MLPLGPIAGRLLEDVTLPQLLLSAPAGQFARLGEAELGGLGARANSSQSLLRHRWGADPSSEESLGPDRVFPRLLAGCAFLLGPANPLAALLGHRRGLPGRARWRLALHGDTDALDRLPAAGGPLGEAPDAAEVERRLVR